jgi:hypothetical protein
VHAEHRFRAQNDALCAIGLLRKITQQKCAISSTEIALTFDALLTI